MSGADDTASGGIPVLNRFEEDEDGEAKPTQFHTFEIERKRFKPYLLVVGGAESVGHYFPIEDGMIIGRAVSADVVLGEEGVSRRHAQVSILPDRNFFFEDCGSSNGMLFGGARVTSQIVPEGSRIHIGNAILVPLYIEETGYSFQRNLFISATEDPGTRLAHRGYFTTVAERECAISTRYGAPLSLALMSIDQYHSLTQKHGAALGTVLLKAAAHIAKRQAPPGALIARHSTDELAVLLPETTLENATAWADEVCRAAASINFDFTANTVQISMSAGLTWTGEPNSPNIQALIARAESRLARAKPEHK